MSESPMPIVILDWKSIKKNSLRGFATVRIGKSLKVSDVAIHASGGRRWASLPSKPQIDQNGVAIKGDDGKTKYIPVLQWMDRETADRFSEAVITAIEAQSPGDTQAG